MKNFTINLSNKKGSAATFLSLFVIIVLSIVIYYIYTGYIHRYYINIYDNKTIDRTIEIPPFVERLTDSNKELIGECDLRVGTSFQQVTDFYKSYSKQCGFSFESTEYDFHMTIRKEYVIEGKLMGSDVLLRWIPDLSPKQLVKAKKLYGKIKTPPIKEDE